MGTVVVLFSGGLDSAVLACHLVAQGHEIRCLTVDYGQAQRPEIDAANHMAMAHNWLLTTLPMGWFATLAPHEGAVVPGRNAVLITLAVAHAQAHGCDLVAAGMHAGDEADFPDCRVWCLKSLGQISKLTYGVDLLVPFTHWPKARVVQLGATLGVPFERTWSCYGRGPRHCGTCLACTNRRNAFREAGIDDPTTYEETVCAG
jgi:7-cyano-7-deazaguanine synthase